MKRYKYVIIGGGVAAGYAVQEFAQQNAGTGQVAIITADSSLPYDRPPLSKNFLAGTTSHEDILLKKADFYRAQGIQVKPGPRSSSWICGDAFSIVSPPEIFASRNCSSRPAQKCGGSICPALI